MYFEQKIDGLILTLYDFPLPERKEISSWRHMCWCWKRGKASSPTLIIVKESGISFTINIIFIPFCMFLATDVKINHVFHLDCSGFTFCKTFSLQVLLTTSHSYPFKENVTLLPQKESLNSVWAGSITFKRFFGDISLWNKHASSKIDLNGRYTKFVRRQKQEKMPYDVVGSYKCISIAVSDKWLKCYCKK